MIHGELKYGRALRERPVIIICHSFMAFKDWGFFPYLSSRFAEAGFASVIFNFSHNGVIGDGDRIKDFERFEKNSFLREVGDLKCVIDALWKGELGGGIVDRSDITLLGHSRGGGISILTASEDDRVKLLVSWSTIGTFFRWTVRQRKSWRDLGFLPLAKDPGASPLRLGTGLLREIEELREKLDLKLAASKIKIPWLLVHGSEDLTVPAKEAIGLVASARGVSPKMILLERVGHLYNASSASEDNYATLDMIIEKTIDWIKENKMKGR